MGGAPIGIPLVAMDAIELSGLQREQYGPGYALGIRWASTPADWGQPKGPAGRKDLLDERTC
jgi:hypothetical protein